MMMTFKLPAATVGVEEVLIDGKTVIRTLFKSEKSALAFAPFLKYVTDSEDYKVGKIQ